MIGKEMKEYSPSKKSKWRFSNYALGLPQGSVRAIAFLASIGAIIYLSITMVKVPQALGALTGAMVAFYFTKKNGPSEIDIEEKRVQIDKLQAQIDILTAERELVLSEAQKKAVEGG